MSAQSDTKIVSTGTPGLDAILNGGLPAGRVYLLQGEPGTGKTTLALQFLIDGAKKNEKSLYITFSENKKEVWDVASSHHWSLEQVEIFDLSILEEHIKPDPQTVFHPSEVELGEVTKLIKEEVERHNPRRIVIDSVSELRALAENKLRYRRAMLGLKQFFTARDCTVLLLDDLASPVDNLQVKSIVHGIIGLEKERAKFGVERRHLNIAKLRGVDFAGGNHDYIIQTGALRVFPQLVAKDHAKKLHSEKLSSGIAELDELLDGGLDPGTSTLFMGPAGSGKSTLALQYAVSAAKQGNNVTVFSFEENLSTLFKRTQSLGMGFEALYEQGQIRIIKIDPAQLSPGQFADIVLSEVKENNARLIVIDSLNGYMHAMPGEDYLVLQLHELLTYLNAQSVATIMVLAQQGLMGALEAPVDLTYLADTVIITRYFEALGAVKKAISVVKKRSGAHEDSLRELRMDYNGIKVGKKLTDFHGVLTGAPVYRGDMENIMKVEDAVRSTKV